MLACVPWEAANAAGIVAPMMLYLLCVVLPQAMAGALTPFPGRAGTASFLAGRVRAPLPVCSSAARLGRSPSRCLR